MEFALPTVLTASVTKKDKKQKRKTTKQSKTKADSTKSKTEDTDIDRHKGGQAEKKRKIKRDTKGDKKGRGGKKIRKSDTQSYAGGTMLVTWVPKKGAHHDGDGQTQASVCSADRLPPPAPGNG